MEKVSIIPINHLARQIYFLRGYKVMLDADLAELYGVTTKRLNEQVKRNIERFPSDFMFRLDEKETEFLRSQIATSNKETRGGRRTLPHVFTEHGAIMLATVLNSRIAVQGSIQVVRAFVQLREMLSNHKDLARKLEELEKKYDKQFRIVFDSIRTLMQSSKEAPKEPIGFRRGQ